MKRFLFAAQTALVASTMVLKAWWSLALLAWRMHGKLYVGDSIQVKIKITYSGPAPQDASDLVPATWRTPLEGTA